MSQTKTNNFTAAMADYNAKRQAYETIAQALRVDNKAALFGALQAAGITQVVVSFDGYGDSGQVENIEATAQDVITLLPDGQIALRFTAWHNPEPRAETLCIEAAIEAMAYDCLSETHGGWENNDGAYGEFVFDVAAQEITLDYNERYTATETCEHTF